MKKILVTGANGFIGRQSLKFLIQKGYDIYATRLRKTENEVNSGVFWIDVDLLDRNDVHKIFQVVQPDFLLHFAWYVDPRDYLESSLNLDWVSSTIYLYKEFIKNGGKRAVFSGTSVEYAWSDCSLKESDPCCPSTVYGTCKCSLFRILEQFAKRNNLSFAWGRIFNLYGPNESPLRFIPYLINSFLNRQRVICKNPYFERDYIHVEDVGRAFVELLENDFIGAVNIGSGNSYILKNLVLKLAKILDAESLVEFSDSQDRAKVVSDVSILKNIIKFNPAYDLDKGLAESVDWWKKKWL